MQSNNLKATMERDTVSGLPMLVIPSMTPSQLAILDSIMFRNSDDAIHEYRAEARAYINARLPEHGFASIIMYGDRLDQFIHWVGVMLERVDICAISPPSQN